MKTLKTLIALGILASATLFAAGQTTISNTPSTDVTEPGSFYAEAGFSGHAARYRNGGYQSYGFKALYGLTRNVEVGTNVVYLRTGGINPIEFSPNVKWKAYSNEKRKFAVSGGVVAYVPTRAGAGAKTIAMVYTGASKAFDFAKGFRVTGGAYKVVGADSSSGNRKGVTLGYEQTLFKRTSLFADWTSGRNRFGYSAVGLSIPIKKKNVLYTGYSFGNTGAGNNGLTVTFGRFF